MMIKAASLDDYFGTNEHDEDDDEVDIEFGHVEKVERKSKQEKTLTKRGGGERVFTDVDELKKDTVELDEPINIDDI